MQIRRLDQQTSSYGPARGTGRSSAGQTGVEVDRSNSHPIDHSTVRTESETRLASLRTHLQSTATVRSDAVQAARSKVAEGYFATRASAEQLAATNLQNDYF